MAAQRVIAGEGDVFVAGGVESISCVQNHANLHMIAEGWLKQHKPEIYWPMLQTAETVAKRYKIDRERQDRYGAESQIRAAAAAAAGKFDDEIVPMTVLAGFADPKTQAARHARSHDLPPMKASAPTRPTRASRRSARVFPGGVITAGNASQFSDGASAAVVMDADAGAEARASSRSASSAASPWPAASPTRWASARSSPYPSCSSAPA